MAISDKTIFKAGGCSFVFVCKKRSFKLLVSPYFDRITENLFDEDLALLMNLPIKNITCSPHTISGVKTWNVGYISTTVQCVQDGICAGEMHLKAKVIRDLQTIIGSHALAGGSTYRRLANSGVDQQEIKVTRKKKSEETQFEDSHPNSPTTSIRTPSRKKKKSSNSSSPSFISTKSSSSINNPRTPPGFPRPMYSPNPAPSNSTQQPITVPASLPMQPGTTGMSPYSANISRLTAVFGYADTIDGLGNRKEYLANLDPGGQLKPGNSALSYAFYRSRDNSVPEATHGPVYQSGHGRNWCRISCRNLEFHPHNCGHHPQWRMPEDFQYCGSECKAGLCGCLKEYSRQNYG